MMPTFGIDTAENTMVNRTMSELHENASHGRPERLALEFLRRVWGTPRDLDAIDELVTDDYVITSGGRAIQGRKAFKHWVKEFQARLLDATTRNLEVFSNASGSRVVSRWVCTGSNNGIFGLPPDQKPISFSGIAIWELRGERLAACWVERSALEAYRDHASPSGGSSEVA